MARSLPDEVTNGTLEGDIIPGDITFFRLQSTSFPSLQHMWHRGRVLPPVATSRSFGAIGIFAIPQMGRDSTRHWLIERISHIMVLLHSAISLAAFMKYLSISE